MNGDMLDALGGIATVPFGAGGGSFSPGQQPAYVAQPPQSQLDRAYSSCLRLRGARRADGGMPAD